MTWPNRSLNDVNLALLDLSNKTFSLCFRLRRVCLNRHHTIALAHIERRIIAIMHTDVINQIAVHVALLRR